MKLFFCPICKDVQKMQRETRKCICGQSWGAYKNEIDAIIGGKAIPLGIDNNSLADALEARPTDGHGSTFTAFVIPKKAPSIDDQGDGITLIFQGPKSRRIELIQKALEQICAAQDKNPRRPGKKPKDEQKKTRQSPGLSDSLIKLSELDAL